MVNHENLKKDAMIYEALDRLELLNAAPEDRWMLILNRALDCKIVVDHVEKSVRREDITEEELKMIKEYELEYDFICYYLIRDEGIWPDGCMFPRYTLLFVDENQEEYEMVKEECIGRCGTVPAYIINMEDIECSEFAEIGYQNVQGLIINVS